MGKTRNMIRIPPSFWKIPDVRTVIDDIQTDSALYRLYISNEQSIKDHTNAITQLITDINAITTTFDVVKGDFSEPDITQIVREFQIGKKIPQNEENIARTMIKFQKKQFQLRQCLRIIEECTQENSNIRKKHLTELINQCTEANRMFLGDHRYPILNIVHINNSF